MILATRREGETHPVVAASALALRGLGYAELAAAVLLMFFICAAIALSVLFRYAFSSPLIWVEEATTIAFIWATFLGAAVAAKADRHITVTALGALLPEGGRIYLDVFVRLFVLCVTALIAYYATGFIGMQNRSNTVSLPINFPRGWMFSIPTFLALSSIALVQMVCLLDSAVRMARGAADAEPVRIMPAI